MLEFNNKLYNSLCRIVIKTDSEIQVDIPSFSSNEYISIKLDLLPIFFKNSKAGMRFYADVNINVNDKKDLVFINPTEPKYPPIELIKILRLHKYLHKKGIRCFGFSKKQFTLSANNSFCIKDNIAKATSHDISFEYDNKIKQFIVYIDTKKLYFSTNKDIFDFINNYFVIDVE